MRDFLKYLLLVCLVVISNDFYCFANNANHEIQGLVENFCLTEFNGNLQGDEIRDQMIKYTSDKLKYLKTKSCSIYPYEILLECDSIFIINSYKINSIEQVDEKHAYAVISYHQLAKSKGWGDDFRENKVRKLIKDIRDITVKLNLEYDGKRWWIIDPPYPRVSYNTMLEYYKKDVADLATYERPKTLKPLSPQKAKKEKERIKAAYNYDKSVLDFLVNLKKQ